jgi:hypothetical protein
VGDGAQPDMTTGTPDSSGSLICGSPASRMNPAFHCRGYLVFLVGSPDLMPQDTPIRASANNALIILIAFTPGLVKIPGSVYQNKL